MTSHFPTPLQSEYKIDTAYCVACLEFIMSRIYKRCSVVGCMDVHKSLHRVPEDERATWIDFILEGEVPATVGKNLLVCAITTLRLFLQLRSVHGRISCETLSLRGVPSNFAWNTCRRRTCKYTNCRSHIQFSIICVQWLFLVTSTGLECLRAYNRKWTECQVWLITQQKVFLQWLGPHPALCLF